MTEPEHSNHWESLAEKLGAEPSETEAPPPMRPAPEPPPPAQQTRQKRPAPETDPVPVSDWNGLGKELGVESEGQAETHGDADSADEVASPRASRAIPDDVLDEDTVAAAVTRVVEEVAEENIDFGDVEAEEERSPVPEAPDETAETTDGPARPTRRRRRRRPRRRAGRNRASAEESGGNGTATSEPEGDAETPSETVGSAVVESTDVESTVEAVDGSDSQDAKMESDDSGKPSRPSHRNIPTWDEAIGVIVDANIEARSSRPKAARAGGSRGRGRGRSRARKR